MKEKMEQESPNAAQTEPEKRTRRRKTETLFGNTYFVNKEYVDATRLAKKMVEAADKIECYIQKIEHERDLPRNATIIPGLVLRRYKHAYAIMQFKKGVDRNLRFTDIKLLQANGLYPNSANYEIVYEKKLEKNKIPKNEQETSELLEELFTIFNVHHPIDFTGYSLSVGDIIAIRNLDTVEFFFVDSIGFKKLNGFGNERITLNTKMKTALAGIGGCIQKKENKVAELTALTKESASENETLIEHRDEMVKCMSEELSGMKKILSQMQEGDFSEFEEFRMLKEEFEKSVESYYIQPED